MPKDRILNYVIKKNFMTTWGAEDVSSLILITVRKLDLVHHTGPTGIAAAAWHIASILTGKEVPLAKIAEAAEIPEKTIRNRCNDLVNHLLFTIYL